VTKEIHFDDFVNTSPVTERHSPYVHRIESPDFTCFGSKWHLGIHNEKMKIMIRKVPAVGILLFRNDNPREDKSININIRLRLAIKDSKGKFDCFEKDGWQYSFNPYRYHIGYGCHLPLYLLRKYLEDGTLRIEVKMKLVNPIRLLEYEAGILPPQRVFPAKPARPRVVEDCPICMEPISKPWGVVIPCGHPFHQSCWDQVVAKHWEESDDESESDDDTQPSCVVCRKVSTGFQRVYLDLGCTGAAASGDNNDRAREEESSDESERRPTRRRPVRLFPTFLRRRRS